MIRKLVLAAALAGMIGASPAVAANQCRDAKGKFIKCANTKATGPAAGVTKDKNGKCHIASGPKKGQFTKCG